MSNLRDKTLALAGVFQAAALVKQVASTGMVDLQDMQTCINSIFVTDPESTEQIYGNSTALQRGLRTLKDQLGQDSKHRDLDTTRYAIALLHLQTKLKRHKETLSRLGNGIERARLQSEHFSTLHENVIANLAGIYSETISQIPPKIMVNGDQNSLSNPDNANKIRALLLAGMRSAVLWGQLGGSRWQILFKRKHFVASANEILRA